MEREQEIRRLVNVLRRTSRVSMQAEWTGEKEDAAAHSVNQYNKVLARLSVLAPEVGAIFDPLPDNASLTIAAMACRQLAAYFEEESGPSRWGEVYGAAFDTGSFKKCWERCATDIEDLGEYIRESVENWADSQRKSREPHEATSEEKKEG